MSLRDQLIAKGVASKKDVRRVEQQLREERKQKQGARKSQAELDAEAAAARRAAEEEANRARLEERRRREAEREARERALQVRQIVRGNAIRSRGPFAFHHRAADGRHLHRLQLSEHVAWKLRAGEAAVAALIEDGRDPEYVVVSARAAARLEELAPGVVVHWTKDTRGLSDRAEALWRPEWEISLRPHRVSGP